MKCIRMTLASALLVASGGCLAVEPQDPVNLCPGLTCEESTDLTKSALAGSPDAALKLFWASLDEGKKEEALYWAQIAMENGSEAGRHNYASLLLTKGDERSIARAIFHLKVLVSLGDSDSAVLLEEAERIQKGKP